MRSLLRLAVLAGLIALASWLPATAHADDLPYCGDIQGTFCPYPGYYIYCYVTYGDYALCTCDENTHGWAC